EILILNMLHRVRRNAMCREEPIEVARPSAVETELDRRAREARDESSLEVDLQVDDVVELTVDQLPPDVGERTQSLRPIEDQDLVDRPVAANERGRAWLEHPRDDDVRRVPLQCVDDGEDVHRVADGAHHDDTNTIQGNVANHHAELSASISSKI